MFYISWEVLFTWSFLSLASGTRLEVLHEASVIKFTTNDNGIDFGFSLGYQNGVKTLVVGAPLESSELYSSKSTGKLYKCSLDPLTNEPCKLIEIDLEKYLQKTPKAIEDMKGSVNMLLGVSIAASADEFSTCAPYFKRTVKKQRNTYNSPQLYGTCFTCSSNGEISRHDDSKLKDMKGLGFGLSMLMDEKNHLTLIPSAFSLNSILTMQFIRKDNKGVLEVLKFPDTGGSLSGVQNIGFGIVAGRFFGDDDTIYVFSVNKYQFGSGTLVFFKRSETAIEFIKGTSEKVLQVNNGDVGSMYGYAMAAGDVSGDGYSELIVGAPTQYEDNVECGAIHIHKGGDMKTISRKDTILGRSDGGRFGLAVASVDIDGDGFHDIIVGAPFEEGGAVYLFLGSSVREKLSKSNEVPYERIYRISELEHQRIQKSSIKLFGYSLQVIEDLDGNGCDEIAVGAPGSASVFLYRCLQTVTAKVKAFTSTNIIPNNISEQNVQVCVSIQFNKRAKQVKGVIQMKNYVTGQGNSVDKSQETVNIELQKQFDNKKIDYSNEHCENIKVNIDIGNVDKVNFFTEIKMLDLDKSLKQSDFDKTVALFSKQSVITDSILFERRCEGKAEECQPKIVLASVLWSTGSEFELGSSASGSIMIKTYNEGKNAHSACLRVAIRGATVLRVPDCITEFNGIDEPEDLLKFTCLLPDPFRKGVENSIVFDMDMVSSMTNLAKSLDYDVSLYTYCDGKVTKAINESIEYKLNGKDIIINSETNNLALTEKNFADTAPETIHVDHVYVIRNNGKLKWLNMEAQIEFENNDFDFSVQNTIPGTDECKQINQSSKYRLNCNLHLEPESVTRIIVGIEIQRDSIGEIIQKVKETNVTSTMLLRFEALALSSNVITTVTYQKEMSTQNNKTLIISLGVLGALLLLAILIAILYKNGFFQKKNKKKLDEARATVRRRSIKRSTTSDTSRLHNNMEDNVEILEDSPFDAATTAVNSGERPLTVNSFQAIEQKVQAEVHNDESKE